MSLPEPSFTVSSIIDEVLSAAHGYVGDQDQSTSLSVGIDSDDLSFVATDADQISRGLVQVDDELIYVTSVDPTSGTATIPAWGRGQAGSTATSHDTGAKVTLSPTYPRVRVANTVYGVLREIFPDVYPVAETTLDVSAAVTNYALPSDCYHILAVEWNPPGPTGMWIPVKRWRQNKTATTVELELLSGIWPGSDNVRVRYIRVPTVSFGSTDNLATIGYDNQIRDLIVLGAVARLIAFTEPSRVQAQSVESHGRSEAVPAGSATALSRYLYQVFSKRLEDERRQIMMRHPTQPHMTR